MCIIVYPPFWNVDLEIVNVFLIIFLKCKYSSFLFQTKANNEQAQPSRPNELPLLPGEKIMREPQEVTYLCPYSGPARGILSVTNYKLHFRTIDKDAAYVVEVPLGVVSSSFF